ncbi:MAG: carboxypeptidase regulatory-like domain-containing protein, partial [Candidatus Hydrogenedentes bacterium]|nr:carboxypeptidase regulatory-like domain-containing protein [Candidatus Hydrogenedentota bacterium]
MRGSCEKAPDRQNIMKAHHQSWWTDLGLAVRSFVTFVAVCMVALCARADTPPSYVSILHVFLPERGAVDTISRAGLVVDDVRGLTATVYASRDDIRWLRSHGYAFTEVGRQTPKLAPEPAIPAKGLGVYHTYATLTTDLQAYAAAFPSISRLISIGRSVQGRELWAMCITVHPDAHEDKPEFKYISTMHGDEQVGTENCLYFIDTLLNGYGTNARVTQLVDSTMVWLLPLMNPDGRELGTRFNAHGVDLNRTFPSYPSEFSGSIYDGEPLHTEGREPEVASVMQWTAQHHFTLSANFHTGSLVVNYPYDDDGFLSGVNSPTPDDALFRDLALRYSTPNGPMYTSSSFTHGIVNGAVWYVITGGMQDWNYRYVSCNDVTIELSDNKTPSQSLLPSLWTDNEESMFSYLEAVHIGVRGILTDTVTSVPLWAKVTVSGNSHPVFTDPAVGNYHRLLLPGTYSLTFSSHGYQSQTINNVVVADGPATRVDLALVRAGIGPTD